MDKNAALAASRSSSWEDRASAAEALATTNDDAEVDAALAMLLCDQDLAVVRRTTACLLALPTARALPRFTASYATADDQTGDSMNDELRIAVLSNPALGPGLLELADNGDPGAESALAWLA